MGILFGFFTAIALMGTYCVGVYQGNLHMEKKMSEEKQQNDKEKAKTED